jgi:hypothetical protein
VADHHDDRHEHHQAAEQDEHEGVHWMSSLPAPPR